MLKQSSHIDRHDVALRAVMKNELAVNHIKLAQVDRVLGKRQLCNGVLNGSRNVTDEFIQTVSSLCDVDIETLQERANKLVRDAGEEVTMATTTYERSYMVQDYHTFLIKQQRKLM